MLPNGSYVALRAVMCPMDRDVVLRAVEEKYRIHYSLK